VLPVTPAAIPVAEANLERHAMPTRARIDAMHVAVAAVHGAEFLLTWNCTHIANAIMRPHIEDACRYAGHRPPTICTPDELMLDGDEP
jgi:hypothetical protein